MMDYDICIVCVPEDETIANTLADSLRHYRLPKGITPAQPGFDYHCIFLDSGNSELDAAARERLDHSRCMIVMCSPTAKSSPGIRDRILYFKKLRRDEDIILVLVKGEPIDAFPDQIIERKLVQHIMPDMRIIEREETIEPVSSDLRGSTPKHTRELMRYETIRITASVLGLHPDDLEQRHRRRRRRAIASAAAVVSAVLMIVSGLFLRLGYIATRQEAMSKAAVSQLKEELPQLFAGDEQAQAVIDSAIEEVDRELNDGEGRP